MRFTGDLPTTETFTVGSQKSCEEHIFLQVLLSPLLSTFLMLPSVQKTYAPYSHLSEAWQSETKSEAEDMLVKTPNSCPQLSWPESSFSGSDTLHNK